MAIENSQLENYVEQTSISEEHVPVTNIRLSLRRQFLYESTFFC